MYRPADTHRAATGVGASAEELRARLAAFERELTGDGDAFGADDLGAVIGTIYGAIHQMAFESYGDNTGDMGTYARKLQVTGVNQKRSEDAAVVEINNVRKMLG
ncbi:MULTISPECIES: hypothetical protein [unclassified Nonomuraea]|uniref:hypothetical protein n=1 Tax=unclassified Nonomuraea TaxID=2593643 RepID=UPI0035BF75D9